MKMLRVDIFRAGHVQHQAVPLCNARVSRSVLNKRFTHKSRSVTCRSGKQEEAQNSQTSAQPNIETPQQDSGTTSAQEPNQSNNKWIAAGAVAFGAALVVFSRVSPGQLTLSDLQKQSIPLDTALQNGRPTLMEFYASWCEVCNDMAPDTAALKARYSDKLNFVMLNIENSRWLPEMAEYRVSGVPHFVFLDNQGRAQAATIGRLPKEVLDINAKALVEGKALPFKRKIGETSNADNAARQGSMSGPRDHA